jgi:hypothetical protein
MGARKFSLKRVIGRIALATVALSGFLLFAGVSNAEARDHHGYYSRQAFERREQVREERARCFREREGWREHRRDWDRDRR